MKRRFYFSGHFVLLTVFLAIAFDGLSQTATYTATGTFTVPAGVTSITVECWGGGGSGGGTTANSSGGGGGGAGGAYASSVLTVVPYQSFTVTVGGTTTGTTGAGAQGTSSWFGTTGTVFAEGGAGGAAPNGTKAGGIGSAAASIGDITIAGADGENGTNNPGGIGGAGGQGGNGGGVGGGQRNNAGGNGFAGTAPGGGGGGAFVNNTTNRSGGNGAAGQVIVSYTLPGSPVTYFSKASGAWNAASTWTTSPTHTGADAGPPVAGDAVVIGNGHTVNTNNGSRACLDLALIGSGILDINQNGNTVTVSGNFSMDGTSQITGTSATRTLNVGGDFTVPATATNARISGQVVTVTGATTIDGSLTLNSATGTKTFNGAVTVNSGGVWNATGNPTTSFGGGITMNGTTFNNGTGAAAFTATQTLQGSSNMTFGGSVTPAASTTLTNSNSATVTINNVVLTGNFTQGLNSPTLTVTNAAPFSGAGTLDASTNTNTVTYTGAAPPIKTITYSNLTINGTLTATVGGATTVNGTMTVNSGVINNSTLTVTTALSGTNTLLQGATSILNIGGTSGITTLDASSNSNTVNYTGAAQTVKAVAYRALGLSGSGVKTMTGVTTIAGDFTIGGTASATAGAALTISGSITLGSGTTFTAGAFTHNLAGNWSNDGATFDNTGSTINLNGAGQSIGGSSSTTFNNLILAGTTTKTFNVPTFMAGDLSISSGVVANLSTLTNHTTNTLTLNGTIQAAGVWGSTASGAANIDDTFFASSAGRITVATKPAITYYSRQTGNWNATTTWSTVTYGNATNAGTFPVAGDIVNMGGGNFTVTVNVASACASLNYQGGVGNSLTVSLNAGITLDVSGVIDLPSTTFFSGDINTLAVGAGILTAGSVDFDGGGLLAPHQITISTGTATINGDFTPSGNSIPQITFTDAGTLNLSGDFLNSGNLTFTAATNSTVNYNGAAQTIGDLTYYNLTISGSDTKTLSDVTDVNGTLTIGAGTTLVGGTFTHTVGGDWVNNGTFTHSGGTINFDGAAQNIGGTNSTTFNNLSLNGSGTKTFSIASVSDGYFNIGNSVVANLGAFTNHTANSLSLGGVGQIAGTWGGTGSAAANINTTYFAAATGILTTASAGPGIYYSRQSGNWDATTTWSTVTYGNATNNGTFPVAGDLVYLGGGNFTVTVNVPSACAALNYLGDVGNSLAVSISPGMSLDVSGVIDIPSTAFFSGDINTLAVGSGTLNAGSIAFSDGGFLGEHELTISTGTVTVSGNITAPSFLTFLDFTFTGAGTLNVSGDFLNSGTSTFTASTGTVNYNGAAQTISDFTYNNLTLSGSGSKTFADATDINGVLTIETGATLVGGVFTHTIGGNWVNNGTFTSSGGTISLDGTAQSIGGSNSTTFNNLTLAGSGTKTFSTITTIDATIAINTGVVANLGTAPAVHTARTLSLNNQGQVPGTWGGTGSGATNINATFFAATTGILNVTNRIYYARVNNGDWDAPGSWSTVTYGNATNSGTFPIAGDIASIGQNLDIIVNVNSACAFITFQAVPPANQENLLTINAGITLDVSGSITIPRAGNGELNTLAVGSGILNAGSILFSNGGGFTATPRHRLTISTGTVTVSGDVSEVGSTGSATITFSGAGQLLLGGAFLDSNNGTLTQSTGTVTYNGSMPQTIGDFTYYNLTLNNTSGTTGQLTLADNTTVTNTLDMTSGIVNLNSATLTLGASGAASSLSRTVSTTTNWMYGGTFSRFWPASTAVTSTSSNFYGLFPVGTSAASSYRPVEINSTSNPTGTGSFSVTHTDANSVTNLSPVFDDGGTNIVRKHNAQFVTATTATGGTYDISVTMTGLFPGTLSDIRLAKSNAASTVTTVGSHAAATGTAPNPTAGRTGVALANLTGDFRITTTNVSATPLPVELINFSAIQHGDGVLLNWTTASELNNDFFTVERLSNDDEFDVVTIVTGKGTTQEMSQYETIDSAPYQGKNYYRLKQTDFDGKVSYSDLVKVEFTGIINSFDVYPVPARNEDIVIIVRNLEPLQELDFQLVTVQGIDALKFNLKADQDGVIMTKLSTSNLPRGVYIINTNDRRGLKKKIIIE